MPGAGQPPVITRLAPASGPAGTILVVEGQRFGTGGTVLFEGNPVATQGTGSPLVFTVPYTATPGDRTVEARISSFTTAPATFRVTANAEPPAPEVDGFEIGYVTFGRIGVEDVMELVLFGRGLDTNTVVEFNGAVVSSGLPGIPAGSLIGAFGHALTLPGFPRDLYGRAVVGRLSVSDGTRPDLGSTQHGARAQYRDWSRVG